MRRILFTAVHFISVEKKDENNGEVHGGMGVGGLVVIKLSLQLVVRVMGSFSFTMFH